MSCIYLYINYSLYIKHFLSISYLNLDSIWYFPHCFISADVANFQAKRLIFGAYAAVPKFFCFGTVYDNKTVFINFDFAIGVPKPLSAIILSTTYFLLPQISIDHSLLMYSKNSSSVIAKSLSLVNDW